MEKVEKAVRKGKPSPNRLKSETINFRVSPEIKQIFYDIADVKEVTLTDLFEEMIADYREKYLGK